MTLDDFRLLIARISLTAPLRPIPVLVPSTPKKPPSASLARRA